MTHTLITLEPRDLDDLDPARRPGICLVRLQDDDARRKAQKCKFKVVSDPAHFVAESAKVPACAGKGHLVIVPTSAITDYSQRARIAAAIMGAFCVTPRDYSKIEGLAGNPEGHNAHGEIQGEPVNLPLCGV